MFGYVSGQVEIPMPIHAMFLVTRGLGAPDNLYMCSHCYTFYIHTLMLCHNVFGQVEISPKHEQPRSIAAQPMLLCADVGGTNTRLHLFKVPERRACGEGSWTDAG